MRKRTQPSKTGAAGRVVFIPGILGSTLFDASLTTEQAGKLCETNVGRAGRALRRSALYPCDKRPQFLWDGVGSLHWLFNPNDWQQRMTSGNGFDHRGNVRVDSLFEVEVRFPKKRFQFKPYAALLHALREAGADVLEFPYDWRLSNEVNARVLLTRILQRWFEISPATRTAAGRSRSGPARRIASPSSATAWAASSHGRFSSHRHRSSIGSLGG